MTEPLDILAIFAHPDDAELLSGGALALSADRGERVGILDLTRGEMGSRGTPELRAREADAAAEVLGAALRRNAGLPDAGLSSSSEALPTVVAFLRELRPRVVVTHWKEGRHPDHVATARLVREAAFLAGLRKYDAPGKPHRPFKVVHGIAFREDNPPPTFVLDISAQMDRKLQAIACYASQFEGVAGMGEIFPAGDRPLADQIRAHGAVWGSRIRKLYGEPYWCGEAVELPSLGTLPVSSF